MHPCAQHVAPGWWCFEEVLTPRCLRTASVRPSRVVGGQRILPKKVIECEAGEYCGRGLAQLRDRRVLHQLVLARTKALLTLQVCVVKLCRKRSTSRPGPLCARGVLSAGMPARALNSSTRSPVAAMVQNAATGACPCAPGTRPRGMPSKHARRQKFDKYTLS